MSGRHLLPTTGSSKAPEKTPKNEARGLLALIQTRSEAEAQEIFRRIRINTYGDDAGALAQQIRDEIDVGTLLEQHQRREQQQQHVLPTGIGSSAPGAVITLPPLRSVIEIPPVGTDPAVDRPAFAFADGKETL
jgi:hypothetical protein